MRSLNARESKARGFVAAAIAEGIHDRWCSLPDCGGANPAELQEAHDVLDFLERHGFRVVEEQRDP